MSTIFIIDDDLAMDVLCESLHYRGNEIQRIGTVDEALTRIHELEKADLVVLDIIMPWPEGRSGSCLSGPATAGMEVLVELKKVRPDIPIIAYSATQDASVISSVVEYPNTHFLSKWETHSLKDLLQKIYQVLNIKYEALLPQSFIVHGQDEKEKLAIKNFLQNILHLPEPVILHEQPNRGLSIMEKFEKYALSADLIFVLLTPDDTYADPEANDDVKYRARQNVIFEMGYFLGLLGRKSGRVLLLYKGKLELPSDINGIIYIDISNGIEAAGDKIRQEVHHAR